MTLMQERHGNEAMSRIEKKYLEGESLSGVEIALTQSALSSADVRMCIIASGAMLRDQTTTDELKAQALCRLVEICRSPEMEDDNKYLNEVLVALILISESALVQSEVLREFAYKAAGAKRYTVRANAVVVLGRLGGLGDEKALSLLKNALSDSDEGVKKNAQVWLAHIKKGDRVHYKISRRRKSPGSDSHN